MMWKKSLSFVLTFVMLLVAFPTGAFAEENMIEVWIVDSYRNVFRSDAPNEVKEISLTMAQNEYESTQIVLKGTEEFTINSISFSDLVSSEAAIPAANIYYNPVGYEYLPRSSSGITTSIRPGDGYCPEWLLNNQSIAVAANTAQPLWITFYVPKGQIVGTYNGTATVQTTKGIFAVNISIEVCDVEVPEGKDAELNFYFWQATAGWYNKPKAEDQIERYFGNDYCRYSDKWWDLMGEFADSCRRNRNNYLTVPTVNLLYDGGTVLNPDGSYTFNWEKFDQFVSFMLSENWIKGLVGNQLAYRPSWEKPYLAYIIGCNEDGTAIGKNVDIASDEAANWFSQFLPALQEHLDSKTITGTQKTWLDIWEQTIVDEPYSSQNSAAWVSLYNYVAQYAPSFKTQEAIQTRGYLENYEGKMDCWIPQLDVLENNLSYFKTRQNLGDEVWFYTCLAPKGNYLNRFIDQPVWMGRSLMWLVYRYGVEGYLHWGWNAWHYAQPRDPYGDCYSVWPDVENGTITETIRLTALRDGAEEYELLRILERTQPAAADALCEQVVKSGTQYTSDPEALRDIRNTLIRAAAGEVPDIPITTELPIVENFENGNALCTVVNGTWNIETVDNNHVYVQANTTSEAIVLFEMSGEDYAVQANLAVESWANGKAVGVLGRYNDQNNYYLWRIGNVAGENRLQLLRKVSGQFTTLYEQPASFNAFELNNLKLVLSGSTLKGYLNGELKVQINDSSLSSGRSGVRSYATDFYVDDVCITDIIMDSVEYLPQIAAFSDTEGWEKTSGAWSTEQLDGVTVFTQSSLAGAALALWGHPIWKNYTASTNIHVDQLNGDSSVGLICGAADDMNYYLWRVAQDNSGKKLLQMFKCANGAFTNLYTEQINDTLQGNASFLETTVSGDTVIVKYNGQEKFRYTSDSEIQGRVGFRSLNSTFKAVSLKVTDESSASAVSDISVAGTIENEEIMLSDSANLVTDEAADNVRVDE